MTKRLNNPWQRASRKKSPTIRSFSIGQSAGRFIEELSCHSNYQQAAFRIHDVKYRVFRVYGPMKGSKPIRYNRRWTDVSGRDEALFLNGSWLLILRNRRAGGGVELGCVGKLRVGGDLWYV